MTNIQDDQLMNQNASAPAVASDEPNTKPKPSKADVDELLNQLEALHQEISAKTVVPALPPTEKKDKAAKLEAPAVTPMIESSDTPQLPTSTPAIENSDTTQAESTPTKDEDLDQFINDLEAKIAEKNESGEQKLSFEEKVKETTKIINQDEPIIKQDEPVINQETPTIISEEPTIAPEEPVAQTETTIKEETPHLQQTNVEENFNQKRPSLDLSGVKEAQTPVLNLNNGQLEENAPKLDQPIVDETPVPNLDQAPVPPASVPNLDQAPVPPAAPAKEEVVNAEDLESQSIFSMLGLERLEQAEKEAFLDDLEKLIWDNFIEVELPLLLNTEEKTQADQILAESAKTEDERKEALLVYLEKFIPNLEEVMYKKALNLKKEMFDERVNKMREQAREDNNLSLMADLDQVQELIGAGRFKTAVELLNKN